MDCPFSVIVFADVSFKPGLGQGQPSAVDRLALQGQGINGSKAEAVCEQASIVLNKRLDIFWEEPKHGN